MFPKGSLLYNLLLFLKGMLMGVANKVPGVSGGAVAYVLDFYNELIYSFQKINGKAFILLINGRFKSLYNYINAKFLIFIVGGMVFSYFTVSKLLDYFLQHNELQVWSLFFGMIIGSSIYLIKKYEGWEFKSYVSLALGIAVGFAITFIHPSGENNNLWFVFICGVIGVSGMTIPGLSGSYILMLLGNYVFLLVDAVNVLNDVIVGVFTGNTAVLYDASNQKYLIIIAVFTLGSVFGLIFLSQILAFVLDRWGKIVNAVIIGFILGSLGTVWPWKEKIYAQQNGVFLTDNFNRKIVVGFHKYLPDFSTEQTWIALLFVVVGVMLVLVVDRFSKTN
ncbi:hypothetical protein AXE80_02050 [Wenyingzhuangia fucanilytica]|uniref:DUF368 domain-containing protein n=1 Tax=Wenyingzhuangia fucanilytica TaxID=1790137 RepID=A0A1B1Y304_9FLAO|nr:DUF368 domain-containing protein [Wenyingzhuangia fucanilytica]ANW95141.1 hypothetical protein AXE80_02050 [Wenyingzhuangia fucanilytica]